MGRHLVALLLAVLLTAGAVTAAAVSLTADQTQVTYAENRLSGDPAAADGLSVLACYGYEQRAYWFTGHTHGASETVETEFRFYTVCRSLYADAGVHSGISMGIVGDYKFETLGDLYELMRQRGMTEYTGLMEAYRQLEVETEAGTLTNTYIRIADYCQYYPLYGWMETPAEGYHWNGSVYGGYLERGKETAEVFNAYFRIPVLEDHWMQVVIDKRTGSVLESVDISEHYRGQDFFRMNTVGVCYDNTAFFTFDPLTEQGNTVDTSLIPGGYGLYAFRYSEASGIDIHSLTTLCPLDATHRPVQLLVDEESGTLQLYTRKEQDTYLTVIDLQTMEILQQLRVLEYSEDFWQFYRRENDFLLGISEGCGIDIWQKNPDGTFRFVFRAPLDPQTVPDAVILYDAVYAFDGQRLAVVDRIYRDQELYGYRNPGQVCGYSLWIFQPEGLAYRAEFTASLASPAVTPPGSTDHPRTENLSVTWVENSQ